MVNNSETNKNTTYQIIVNKASDEGDAKAVTNQAMNKAKKIRSIGIGILAKRIKIMNQMIMKMTMKMIMKMK